jgi:hypothetical protein
MVEWKCASCGVAHDKLPASVEWQKPYDYFAASPEEQESFVRVSEDLCHLGDERHFLRVELTLPVVDHQEPLILRVWAGVGGQNFWRYAEFLENVADEPDPPRLPAFFCGVVHGFAENELLWSKIWLHVRRGNLPEVCVDSDHILAAALQNGVSVAFAESIIGSLKRQPSNHQ